MVPLDIDCTYSLYNFHAVGDQYRCLVSNDIIIYSKENTQINTLKGTHVSGKDDDSEIYFHIDSKPIQYFPRGMEKFFKNLRGIAIWHTHLKEIHQEDLKPFPNLNNLHLTKNDIEIIQKDLFDYNPELEFVIIENAKIVHIVSTVFDNLSKLTNLYLYGNKCTSQHSFNNRTETISVINSIKQTCIGADYLSLEKKLENLEEISENSVLAGSKNFH